MPATSTTSAFAPSFTRTGVTAVDPDASALGAVITAPSQTVRIGASGDTPGASISLSVYFLGATSQPVTVQRIGFTAQTAPDWGKTYVGMPDYDTCWPLSGAKAVVLKVDSITPGSTWTIAGTMV